MSEERDGNRPKSASPRKESFLLDLVRVTARYGDGPAAVEGVSLGVHAGKVAALLGPNGAGKSTLLRLAAGTPVPYEVADAWK